MNRETRIELNDTGIDVLMKMGEGNPGAIAAMTEILKNHDKIDPQAIMGGIGAIMMLDTYGIYGSDIYALWSEKCNRDVRCLLVLLRATQLGLFSQLRLKDMASDQMREVNLTEEELMDLDDKVCERLEQFKKRESND